MSWATGVMVYIVIWWTVLFAVLPLGVRRVEKPGKGEEQGPPSGLNCSARQSSRRPSRRCSGWGSMCCIGPMFSASAGWSTEVKLIS